MFSYFGRDFNFVFNIVIFMMIRGVSIGFTFVCVCVEIMMMIINDECY